MQQLCLQPTGRQLTADTAGIWLLSCLELRLEVRGADLELFEDDSTLGLGNPKSAAGFWKVSLPSPLSTLLSFCLHGCEQTS